MRRFIAAWLVAVATIAHAEYPEKPIHLIVPFAAGGGADALARAVGEGMARVLKQPVLIENKGGGDATIGTAQVAKAAPDGYTLGFGSNTGLSGAPYLHRDIGYDPLRDFTPISMFGTFPYFITASNDFPPRTLREFVDYARAHPGEVNYASGNAMGIIATAQLAALHHLQMTHVPYKGEAPAMPDLLSNRVQVIFTTGFIIPHAKEGRVRLLAAMNDERNPQVPDVPTVAEAGFPELSVRGWAGLVGPAGLSREITAKLSSAVNEALRTREVQEQLALQGFPGKGSTPAEMARILREQYASWGAAVKAAGIRPD